MANVHGFRDINQQRQNNRNNNYRNLNNPPPNLNDSIPFLNNNAQQRAPLEQTIPFTLKSICCPTIKLLSISVILSIIMFAMFIFCCTQGITKQNKNILQISANVLLEYGAAQDIVVKNGQVHRLLIASFLHMNLLHVVMNLVCFMFLLSRLEKTFDPKVLGIILLASAISGNILSVLCNKHGTISAGASGIIFGVIGTYLAFMTINWQTLAAYPDIRSQICCTVGILVFFSILFSFGQNIDMYGHFGGMIGGYFAALAVLPGIQQKSKKFTTVGSACFGAYLLVTFLVFFIAY